MPDRITALGLTVALFKYGCRWEGDIVSKRWSEYLIFPDNQRDRAKVKRFLDDYEEGVAYKLDSRGIWIS